MQVGCEGLTSGRRRGEGVIGHAASVGLGLQGGGADEQDACFVQKVKVYHGRSPPALALTMHTTTAVLHLKDQAH
jgi:hypothetical protein